MTGKLALNTLNDIGTTFLTKIKEVFGTFTFGEDFKKTISGTFESIMKPIKAVIGEAGTAEAPGKGILGFLNGIKNLLPMDTIKKIGSFGFGALKLLVRPFVQFFLSLFDFVGGVFKGADEAEKEKVGENEKLRLMFTRGIEGIFQGLGQAVDLLFVDLGGWISEKLGFKKFATFLAKIDVAANIKKSFDYIFGIGQYREKGGLPSDIGKLFAEAIPKALQKGKDKLSAIGDTIANMFTSVKDWFKENFSLEKLLENSPNLKKALQFAGAIGKTKGEIEAEIAMHQKEIAAGDERFGFGNLQSREDAIKELQAELQKVPSANIGGITTKQGLVNIHPQEAIIPLEKMDEVINKINTAALSKTGGAGAPVVVNNVTNAPVDASSSSVTNAATTPISPPTNYVAIL